MTKYNRLKPFCITPLAAAIAFVIATDISVAAEAEKNKDGNLVEEVVVTAGYRKSLWEAMELKRDEISFSDSIVATDIAAFPDQNLAEAIQRVPGVSIFRSYGSGTSVSVRNLGPSYTHTTVNNLTTASGSGGRDVNFEVFASELVQTVTVKKSPTASDEEGGLAGAIQITTARPFDYDGFKAVGSVEGAYNDYSEEFDPRVSFLVSNTFADDRFGILFTMAKEERSYRDDTNRAVGTERTTLSSRSSIALAPGLDGSERFTRWHVDRYNFGVQDKTSATVAFDFLATDTLKLGADILISNFKDGFDQFMNVTDLSGATGISDYTLDSEGIVTAATFSNAYIDWISKRQEEETDFIQVGLTAEWELGDWQINGLLGTSEAEATQLERQANYRAEGVDARYQFDGDFLTRSAPGGGTGSFFDPSLAYFQKAIIRDKLRKDKKDVFQVDAERMLEVSWIDSVRFGMRYSQKSNSYDYNSGDFKTGYTVDGKDVSERTVADDGVIVIPGHGFMEAAGAPSNFQTDWLLVPTDVMLDTYWTLGFVPPTSLGSFYEVNEDVLGVYAESDLAFEVASFPVKLNLGARYVNTDVSSLGYQFGKDSSGNTVDSTIVDAGGSYDDFLPSLNMTVEFSDELLGRFSMARVMTRPTPSDISAKWELKYDDSGEHSINAGNPELEPTRANQADIGLEYYFAPESLLAVAVFYKDLRSFNYESEGVYIQYDGVDYELKQKQNGEGASIMGAEFIYQAPFTFLPSPFDGFGINFNYSYVKSTAGDTYEGKTYELKDLSTDTFNTTFYYEKYGFDARFAYNYRSKSILSTKGIYRAPYGQLDFSAGYEINDNIKVTLKAINLTEEYDFRYYGDQEYNNELDAYGRRISLGIRAKF
jgi:iron complex outermembrane recepter protein